MDYKSSPYQSDKNKLFRYSDFNIPIVSLLTWDL